MPTYPTSRSRRTLVIAAAVAAVIVTATPDRAGAGPIGESFRRWSQGRQTRTRVEKPFSHQTATVDLGVHPSAWSKVKSSGMAGVAKAASAGGRSSALGKLRGRLSGRGEENTGFQQSTTPIHHAE